ncbi:TonB-dependent receptor [Tenacibaculum sp. M341]|uniref:TonB-dependent receptor n=1 Tax=Tenacibaculum sp. M341 TaxID=2530339 RepID=UPI0010465573|nr:TonB-dependent receptor [Tenacibaculum sp. M341]TCI92620.1 TonB-dependent receptor [Tenacibaculum sp. M341]
MKKVISLVLILFSVCSSFSQEIGIVKGKVIDKQSREKLPFVNVVIEGTKKGATTNDNGEFEIKNVSLGYVKVSASFVGYETVTTSTYLVTKEKSPYITIELSEVSSSLDEIVVSSSLFKRRAESPVSLQSLGVEEIEKNPGGNRDILKVIQSFPGVASNPGFRNDIIIRGGATSENKFYVDGIEVPVINHFQTQGASGGPVGMINTDLIRNVDFYSSAFPANRGNSLSSVIEFTQKVGNQEKFEGRASLGTSDAGITLQGPLSKNTSVIVSARQSYLKPLFKLLKLTFLPTYNDFQLNFKSKLSDRDELSIFGLAAIDDFEINLNVNDGETDEETIKRNTYFLNVIPIQTQWNYTVGASYKHYEGNSKQTYVLSRNEWKNDIVKYKDNTNLPADLLNNYQSKEIENKFRFENDTRFENGIKLNLGIALQQSTYQNSTFERIANLNGNQIVNFSSEFSIYSYGMFAQASKKFFSNRLQLSLGLRTDGNTYNEHMENPLNQFSPRIAASLKLADKWYANSSVAKYYQLPAYTMLGFRDNNNALVNQPNLKYISALHTVGGLEFRPEKTSKITLEGFYKQYGNYPFSLRDQISLANLGADFGVVGSEAVVSNNEGRAYGFEFLAQKKSYDGIYGILAYTFVRSEFKDVNNQFIPSTWDNRHLLTFTGGKKLRKNWEIGTKFRLVGGRPFTPNDYEASAIIERYDVVNGGIPDYTRLNSERLDLYTQLDFRVDKTWFLKRFSINLYLDVQNVYATSNARAPLLLPNGIDPTDPTRYILEEIDNTGQGRALPRIGVIVDF